MKRRRSALGLGAATTLAAACLVAPLAVPGRAHAAGDQTLAFEGGSFPERIVNQLMLDDQAAMAPIAPSYFDANIDQARDDFASGANDVAVSEFPLTSTQATAAAGRKFAYVPFAATGVALGAVLICNLNVTTVVAAVCPNLQVTAAQAEGLFTNRIGEWNDTTNLPTISGGTGPVSPKAGSAVIAQNPIDPSASNYGLESYFENDTAAKPLWESWVKGLGPSLPTVSERWASDKGISGGDMAVDNALIPVDPATLQIPPNPQLWAKGANVATVPADWLGAPWNIPTLAVQNAAGTFVNPTPAAETAALNDASMDPTTNLVTFPANGGSDSAAYPMMTVDYLIVPTTGLSSAKATALAQFIHFILSADGAKDISSFGSVPVTAAMAQAGTDVANALTAEATTTTTTTSTTVASASTDAGGATTTPTSASSADQSSSPTLASTGANTALLVAAALFLISLGVLGRRLSVRRATAAVPLSRRRGVGR